MKSSDAVGAAADLPYGSAALPAARRALVISIRQVVETRCDTCNLGILCLRMGLEPDAMRELDAMVSMPVRVRKGEALYRAGERFASLYAIRVGSCKTVMLANDGRDQVIGYHMIGDIIGTDGIGTASHACEAIAVEDSEVCALPFHRIEALARRFPRLQHRVHQLLSRDIGRDQNLLLALGSMRAEERLAGFLLSLSDRYRQRGYSSSEFVLRMTREEIGSFLGLKLETISRLFSRFQREGLLQAHGRDIKLLDLLVLRQVAGHSQ